MKKRLIYYLFFLGSLTSCGFYRQNVVNVPLFQEKGQVQAGGHFGCTGFDGQVGFAVTDKIAIIGNINSNKNTTNYSSTNSSHFNHQFYEFGLGHFRKTPSGLIHEYFLNFGQGNTLMTGYGGDTIYGHTAPFTYTRSAKYSRIMLQADFGKIVRNFEYAISPRLFILDFHSVTDTENNSYLTMPHTFLWSDLAMTFRYCPTKFLKLSSQVSCIFPLTGLKQAYYDASPFNASIGLILNLDAF